MKLLDLTAVETSGLTLIEASAGTGKTWTITALYILLVLEQRLRPEEILVVTYTKAATAELRDRIRKRIVATIELYAGGREPADELERMLLNSHATDSETTQKLLTRALYSFDDAAIFTIHGFCQRALLENAFESGSLFDTGMTTDQSAVVRQVCDDFWRSHIMEEDVAFLERLVADRVTPELLVEPFDGHLQDPNLKVVPKPVPPDMGALIEQRDALLVPLTAMWRLEREIIIQELKQANLSQTWYKPEKIEAAALKLDACLSDGGTKKGCDWLMLFSSGKIEAGMKNGSIRPAHPFFGLCQQVVEAAGRVERGHGDTLVHRQVLLLDWLRKELGQRKLDLNVRCYDDLLLDLFLALEGSGGDHLAASLRQRYQAALIDEFQDTDPLQWKIFSRIAGVRTGPISGAGQGDEEKATQAQSTLHRGTADDVNAEMCPKAASYPLFLIGDPKQAIYSFRGADIHAYIAAAQAVENSRQWTLETNRRSTAGLTSAVNALFRNAEDPFLSGAIRFRAVQSGRDPRHQLLHNGHPVEQPLRFWVHRRIDQVKPSPKGPARAAAVAATAAEISCLLYGSFSIIGKDGEQRPLMPRDIAILVKAHYQSDQIQHALSALSIPSVQHGSATIFQSQEALDLLRVLRAAAAPAQGALVREALLTPLLGLSANEVYGLHDNEMAWEEWLLRFRTLHDCAGSGGIIALVSRLLGECGVRKRILCHVSGERRMTNILHCTELIHQAEQEHGSGLEDSITWLERRITGKQEDDAALLRLETDDNAVTISTIHASKGLEYPVVFLPFAWDPPSARKNRVLFHDHDGSLVLDLGSDKCDTEHRKKALAEQEAEAARLLYVAVTRAEFLCYIGWGCINDAYGSPLRRLLHGDRFKDAKAFAAAGDQCLLDDIAVLAHGDCPSHISARFMPTEVIPAPAFRGEDDKAPYACRTMATVIPEDWCVSSFSGMVAGSGRPSPARDYDADASISAMIDGQEVPLSSFSIFDFPRGAAAGTCLHEILERLNFSAVTQEDLQGLIRNRLGANGYDLRWFPALSGMTADLIRAKLLSDDISFGLSCLQQGAWQSELEFFLPINTLSPDVLEKSFHGYLDKRRHGDFDRVLAELNFKQSRGMLHGFMDMVFTHNGRYYIIDWKSNHLGNRQEDYRHEALSEAMAHHSYILQYHLYTLALDRLLRLRLPDYDYETHFGGAIYIFLRGIRASDSDSGIFRDRPSAELIRELECRLLVPLTGC